MSIHCGVMAAFIGLGRSSGIATINGVLTDITKGNGDPVPKTLVNWGRGSLYLCYTGPRVTRVTRAVSSSVTYVVG